MGDQLQLWETDGVSHNVFLAIRPTAEASVQIQRVRHDLIGDGRFSGKLLLPEHLHVSLLAIGSYVGMLPPAVMLAAKTAAKAVSVAPFTVAFDRVVTFGGNAGRRAIVLTGGDGVAGIIRLQKDLSTVMTKAGFGTRQTNHFTPHLTMMYADSVSERSIQLISWMVKEFVLIDSLYGQSKHVVLGHWALCGQQCARAGGPA